MPCIFLVIYIYIMYSCFFLIWNCHLDVCSRIRFICKAFLRPVLTYGFTAWISSSADIYKKLQILDRHTLRIAYRVKLSNPTRELYNRITFRHLLYHLETLRLKYIIQGYDAQHPLLIDIIQTQHTEQ